MDLVSAINKIIIQIGIPAMHLTHILPPQRIAEGFFLFCPPLGNISKTQGLPRCETIRTLSVTLRKHEDKDVG